MYYGVQCMDYIVKSFDNAEDAKAHLIEMIEADGGDIGAWSIDAEEAGLSQFWVPREISERYAARAEHR